MKDPKDIQWLYSELPELVQKGVITAETAEKLKAHYGTPSKTASFNIVFIISAILGSILIGLGIILLFAYNWDELSRNARTVLSFLPMILAQVVYGYAVFRKKDSVGWIEGSSGFLMLMVGSSIALISQTYNLGGTLSEFLFTWMLLSIPLIYLRNATLPFFLYMVGITWRYLLEFDFWWRPHRDLNALIEFWILVLAVVPHMVHNIKPLLYTVRANIIGWTFAVCAYITAYHLLGFRGGLPFLLYMSCLFAMLYVIGKFACDHTRTIWKKPFQFVGIAGIFIISICATFEEFWKDYNRGYFLFDTGNQYKDHFEYYALSTAIGVIILAGIGYRVVKRMQINLLPALFPALIGTGILLTKSEMADVATWIFDVFLFVYGVYYIWQGVNLGRFSLVNAGMFFIAALIGIRFLSSDLSFIVKGTVFILIGIGFLGVNFWLSRKLKRNE